MNNLKWSQEIIDLFVKQGITQFFVGPGRRSTTLALAIGEHPQADSIVHFDERGLAFCAYGYAKGCGKPGVVVATAGTAVANLFPAVMEAAMSKTPLILLTADRPPELRDIGANQTADQVKIFGNYVTFSADIPCPTDEVPENYLASLIAYAIQCSRTGPVHLNCMFREPFLKERECFKIPTPCHYEVGPRQLENPKKWADFLNLWEKGVIVAGRNAACENSGQNAIFHLAEKLGWPIIADPLSGLRERGRHPALIPFYNTILEASGKLEVDGILHFGDRTVSKPLSLYLKTKEYCLVSEHNDRYDPFYTVTHRIEVSPKNFCNQLLPHLDLKIPWFQSIKEQSDTVDALLKEKYLELSEIGIVLKLAEELGNISLFIGNSMPIRDIDSYYFPEQPTATLFANRGVSGIDGNIATAAGIALGTNKPIVALIGDNTALHDLNSLALLKEIPESITILIINNGGGGIFSFFPLDGRSDIRERYFAGAHSWNFEQAANMFGLDYSKQFSLKNKKNSSIIEISTNREENLIIHEQIKKILCSAITNLVR